MLAFLVLLCVIWIGYWSFALWRDKDKHSPVYISRYECADCANGNAGSNPFKSSKNNSGISGARANNTSTNSTSTNTTGANNTENSRPSNHQSDRVVASSRPPEQSRAASGVVPLFTAPTESADDLKEIKGVGEVMEGTLNDLGITTFKQLANFQDAEIQMVTDALSELNAGFGDRITRDEWVNQAKVLAAKKLAQ